MAIAPGTLGFQSLATSPDAPPSGFILLYTKTDNVVYIKDSSGTEIALGTASGITSLTGDVTASGPGVAAAIVAFVGGKTAAEVAQSVNDTIAATASNTPSTIVKRDASGNFSAGIITAALTGAASANVLKAGDTMTGPLVISNNSAAALAIDGDVFIVDASNNRVGINRLNPTQALDVVGNGLFSGTITASNVSGTNTGDVTVTDTATVDFTLTGQDIQAAVKFGDSTIDANASGIRVAPLSIANAQIALAAAIAYSKLNLSNSILDSDINTAAAIAYSKLNLSNSITNTDISTTAAIVRSKLASGLANRLVVNDGSGVMTDAAAITANRALISDANGIPTHSVTTNTELSYVSGVTSSIQTQINSKLNKAGDTMTGDLNMGSNNITSLASPVNPNDAANKDYVDLLSVGIIPQDAVLDPDVIDDSLSTPPVSPVVSTTYLIGPSPTGAWAAIGAGRLAYWDGSVWRDGLGRSVIIGDRLGIGFEHVGSFGGNFVGQAKKIAVITNATPGSYAYTFETPLYRWTTWIDNSSSDSAGNTYYFNGTDWIQIASGFTADPGDAISISGTTINVKYDNVGVGLNGSNELILLDHASTHLPGGSDALTTASAVGLDATSVNSEGTNLSFARSDHTHDISTGTPVTQSPDQANAEGTSPNLARADHVHNIPTAVVVSTGNANTEGVSTSFARADHVHNVQTNLGILNTAGVLSPDYDTAVTQTPDQTNSTGTSNKVAMADHVHNIPSGAVVQVGTSNFNGASASFALADHVHAHGNQTSGTLHAAATTSVNGFMSATDKTKLDNATSSNTPSTLVLRDASGNFSAGTITADLTGAASANLLRAGDSMTGYFRTAIVALTDGATINTDASLGNVFTVTIAGNRTFAAPTNPLADQKITYKIRQDAIGGRIITWDSAFNFGVDLSGVPNSTSPNTFDYYGFQYNDVTSRWDCLAISRGY